MDKILQFIITCYLAGDTLMVLGYTLAGVDKLDIIIVHLAASFVALIAGWWWYQISDVTS